MTWQVRGQRHRRSFRTEDEARRFAGVIESQLLLSSPPRRITGGLTVAEVVENWYRDHRRNLASGTRRDYEGRIRLHVARIGELDAEAVARNPRQLREFYSSLGPTSARRLHAILRQAFQDALVHDEVSRNPCDLAKPRKPRPAERLIPSPSEIERMLVTAADENPIWGLFVNVSATLGTRRAETCALRWEDLDFRSRRVHIRRALCKGADAPVEVKPPKTGHERTLTIGEEFFAHIRRFRRPGGWMFSGGRNVPPGNAPWHPDWPGHRFQRLMHHLDMPYTLHSLRHFVATHLLSRGLPVTQVAQFMGHKDPSVTMDLYANHVVDDVQRLMGEAAASLFGRIAAPDVAEHRA